jgi:inosine triphosphate pyrophosphatase
MAVGTITFITGNANKLREVNQILGPLANLQSKSLDLVEIQGELEEVVIDKTLRAYKEV